MVRVLSLLVENNPGVLATISGLFSSKFYNMESLTVGITNDPSITHITLVCKGNDAEFDQIKKQLNRLVDVIKVTDLTQKQIVKKELALIKVFAEHNQRGEILQIVNAFNSKVMDVSIDSIVLEISDSSERIDDLLIVLQPYNVLEIARSGLVAMEHGRKRK